MSKLLVAFKIQSNCPSWKKPIWSSFCIQLVAGWKLRAPFFNVHTYHMLKMSAVWREATSGIMTLFVDLAMVLSCWWLVGFTPLILASTAGHSEVVEILIDNGADIEAQSERTKDTPLSLACSGGRYEVVEILLRLGANKEHRNVSDYTPLSLAASGGYVNIIKLLLSYGAEINSRYWSSLWS